MCSLPEDIPDDEKVVRVINSMHLKKGHLKYNAFKPPVNKTVVSVIRQPMGDDFCKDKAVEITEPLDVDYVGLAAIAAVDVRNCGSDAVDAREDYCGHAHIDHGFPTEPAIPHEPGSPEHNERMRKRCKCIKDKCQYQKDPAPGIPGWQGNPL